MSFDQDPNEQAQISGADFAVMCDEMQKLKAANAELVAALDDLLDIAQHSHGVVGYRPNGAVVRWYEIPGFERACATRAKHKGETS